MALNGRRHVEVHIDELALEGFAEGDERAVGEALRQELSRALAAGAPAAPALRASTRRPHLDAGEIAVAPGAGPRAAGAAAGRSLAAALTRGGAGGGR